MRLGERSPRDYVRRERRERAVAQLLVRIRPWLLGGTRVAARLDFKAASWLRVHNRIAFPAQELARSINQASADLAKQVEFDGI